MFFVMAMDSSQAVHTPKPVRFNLVVNGEHPNIDINIIFLWTNIDKSKSTFR